MKTNSVRQISLGLAAGLTFFLGCARPSAQPDQSRAVIAPTAAPVVVAQGAPAVGVDPAPPPSTSTNPPAIIEKIPPTVKTDAVAMSPGLGEVVKLAQAGVGEEVMLAYVDKYSGSFNVGSDQILYLNDLGVSGTVITAMLKHDGSNVAAAPPSQPPTQTGLTTANAPTVEAPLTPTPQVAPPPSSPEVSYFYDSLSPYGSWVYLSGYGWCWQPTVAVTISEWRPYCDRGRWYWSDSGWYWQSDYTWGWAAFHYGRWYHHPGCGWVWAPGIEWGPSWVSWRYSDGYCGWAPLPPEAVFVHGAGFTYFGRHVSVGFEFGLSDFHYAFVDVGHFCDYAPYRHFVPRTTVRNVYRNTTVINNYIVGNNNTVINHGVGRETIARSSQTRIREVSVRETPVQNLASVRGERIEKQGNQTVIVRPQLPKTPPQVRSAEFVKRTGNQPSAGVGRSTVASPAMNTQPTTGARVQTGIAARNNTAENNQDATHSARVGSESHVGKPVVNPQPEQPQRVKQPLFGNGGANNNVAVSAPQQNNAAVARSPQPPVRSAPLVPTQPNYNAAGSRNYSAGATPLAPQTAARTDPRFGGNPNMSPRGYEQTPRASQPNYYSYPGNNAGAGAGAAVTPRSESHSEGRQSTSGSGGGNSHNSGGSGRSDSGSGRSDHSGRNH